MLAIDDALRDYLESGVSSSLSTRSADLVPFSQRAWGQRVSADGRSLEVFIDRPLSARTIANLQDNGRIAVTSVDVITFRSLQLKGRCVEIGDPAPEDWAWVERHRKSFSSMLEQIGFPGPLMRNMWSTQVVKLRFVVEDFYDQTPGPGAGRQL